uniref:Uncharacterized protein n=1 Tax=Papilio polytes TaxID=76194 RepID=I4DSF3_PAPPL|nr:unknown unsecreted protein [Papilio polytes]
MLWILVFEKNSITFTDNFVCKCNKNCRSGKGRMCLKPIMSLCLLFGALARTLGSASNRTQLSYTFTCVQAFIFL